MKIWFAALALLFTSYCSSNQLHDFNQVKSAVMEGKLIRILVDYTQCSSQGLVPNSAAVYTPNAMAISSDGNSIGAYILYFTVKDPRYPAKPVYQYGRYILSSDNSVKLIFTVLNAADYSALEGEGSVTCKIDAGAKLFVNSSGDRAMMQNSGHHQ